MDAVQFTTDCSLCVMSLLGPGSVRSLEKNFRSRFASCLSLILFLSGPHERAVPPRSAVPVFWFCPMTDKPLDHVLGDQDAEYEEAMLHALTLLKGLAGNAHFMRSQTQSNRAFFLKLAENIAHMYEED